MKKLRLDTKEREGLRLLCLGAHSDDIEIGCGGTLFSFVEASPDLSVHWTVFSAQGVRRGEARAGAARVLEGVSSPEVEILGFRDGFLPFEAAKIKEHFERIKAAFEPDLILTHWMGDRHQDHKIISELTWQTFRNHLILEYEVPKYDGDLGNPNLFISLTEGSRHRKLQLLSEVFRSQANKHWWCPETFDGLMRLRGMECASETGYAEGFHSRKAVLGVASLFQDPA